MKYAISYNTAAYGTDPDAIVAVARHAEACGFESFVVPEHLVLHPGAKLGDYPLDPDLAIADPIPVLAFVAAATRTIDLGTAVLLLPLRDPVVLAKELATVDVLARGRLRMLTVGLGSLPGEAAALGVDFVTRARRADEAIDVMRLLWSAGADGASYAGEFFAFEQVCVNPKPVAGTLAIRIGGSSRAAARRAGGRGDGYFPGGMLLPAERATQLAIMRSEAERVGRDPALLDYTRWGSLELDERRLAAFGEQGVDRLVVAPPVAPLRDQLDALSRFADEHLH